MGFFLHALKRYIKSPGITMPGLYFIDNAGSGPGRQVKGHFGAGKTAYQVLELVHITDMGQGDTRSFFMYNVYAFVLQQDGMRSEGQATDGLLQIAQSARVYFCYRKSPDILLVICLGFYLPCNQVYRHYPQVDAGVCCGLAGQPGMYVIAGT